MLDQRQAGRCIEVGPGLLGREMRRMIDEQVVPRILKSSGLQIVTRLKRFHSFGIGESRALWRFNTNPQELDEELRQSE